MYHSLHKSGYIFASYIVGLYRTFSARRPLVIAQDPEEMCLSLEHQNRSKTSEKWVILITLQFRYTLYRLQTKRLRARKIGLQYTLLTRHFVPRLPFGRRAVRQRGYGLRLLIFKMANNKVDLGQIRSVYSRFMRL